MILLTDAASIIESIYLGQRLITDKFLARIIVNPTSTYFENKIIWINSPHYDLSVLAELSKYNDIRSRIKISNASFKYRYIPYRGDRIRNIHLKLIKESNYEISRGDLSKVILFQDVNGDLATILPRGVEITRIKNKYGMSAFELYLTLINNSFENGGKPNI